MIILSFLNDQVLKMEWLSSLIGALVQNVFGLDLTARIGASVHFFLYDTIKIFILLIVLIYVISYIQSYFPPERTRRILGGITGVKANIVGALLGTVTPFCSCSSIPLFIGFTGAGLPLGVTFSFLISSPLVDLASIILLASIFNWKIALVYVLTGLVLAVIGGTVISASGMEDQVEAFVYESKFSDEGEEQISRRDRRVYAGEQVLSIVKKVWPYILVGVAIGAAIHNWIPTTFIERVLGSGNPFSVLLATLLGAPMYADIFGTLPIAEALVAKGVGVGTVLAFMMSVTVLSLPSLVMLKRVIKPKLLTLFVSIVLVGIIFIGYGLNAVGPWFV